MQKQRKMWTGSEGHSQNEYQFTLQSGGGDQKMKMAFGKT